MKNADFVLVKELTMPPGILVEARLRRTVFCFCLKNLSSASFEYCHNPFGPSAFHSLPEAGLDADQIVEWMELRFETKTWGLFESSSQPGIPQAFYLFGQMSNYALHRMLSTNSGNDILPTEEIAMNVARALRDPMSTDNISKMTRMYCSPQFNAAFETMTGF